MVMLVVPGGFVFSNLVPGEHVFMGFVQGEVQSSGSLCHVTLYCHGVYSGCVCIVMAFVSSETVLP